MEEIEKPKYPALKLGRLEIEFYAMKLEGIGLGVMVGSGMYWRSIRLECTLLFIYFGCHFIWNNPNGGGALDKLT